jgi:hypothetical protein
MMISYGREWAISAAQESLISSEKSKERRDEKDKN